MAKVTHFVKDGKVLCGTKAKAPVTSETFSEVTCKRCLKKAETNTNGAKAVEDRKHGFCLEFKNGKILKLGNDLNMEVGMMVVMDKTGHTVTSMKLSNTRGLLDRKEENFFRNYFDTKKTELKRTHLVSEVFTDFK